MARPMICLDSNYLIRGLSMDTAEASQLMGWAHSGEMLTTATPCWFEFLCGPVTPAQIAAMRAFLRQIIPFEEQHAAAAARLYNLAGRRRKLRVDAMVAGSALAAGARLATNNKADFRPFVPHGLVLL